MRRFGRNAVIGAIGLAIATLAVAPAQAGSGRHDRNDRWQERHERQDHAKRFDRAKRYDRVRRHGHAKRHAPGRTVVYHRRGRTVIVVPDRGRRTVVRHRRHHGHHHGHGHASPPSPSVV